MISKTQYARTLRIGAQEKDGFMQTDQVSGIAETGSFEVNEKSSRGAGSGGAELALHGGEGIERAHHVRVYDVRVRAFARRRETARAPCCRASVEPFGSELSVPLLNSRGSAWSRLRTASRC